MQHAVYGFIEHYAIECKRGQGFCGSIKGAGHFGCLAQQHVQRQIHRAVAKVGISYL